MIHTKKQIAETWNSIAKDYSGYRRKSWPAVNEFLKTKQQVFDIGCGNANYLRKQDLGLDISFEMCKLSKKRCKVICGDATSLPIKSKSFKKVLSVATIHQLPTKEFQTQMLEEINRILKPKGEALLTATYRWQKKYFPKNILFKNVYLSWGSVSRFYYLFSKSELATLASRTFQNYEVKIEQATKYKNLYLHVYK